MSGNALAAECTLDNNFNLPGDAFIEHDVSGNAGTSLSYCELCGYGYVTFDVVNPFKDAVMTNITVIENLNAPGLVYDSTAPNPIRVNGVSAPGSVPTGAGSILTFNNLPDLAPQPGNFNAGILTVRFAVRRVTTPESLVSVSRNISANLTFDTELAGGLPTTDGSCDAYGSDSDADVLPLREPIPTITKTGWNYDAGQRQGSASDAVYGNNNDDVVWRIRIGNTGLAGLQDLRLDDLMDAGNLVISHACPTQGTANTIANNNGGGAIPANCVGASNTINDFIVTNPFGDIDVSPDGFEVDVSAGDNTSIYLVGKITADGSCVTSQTNTVNDVQWGCQAQPPAGGISATSTGSVPTDAATLFTRYNSDGNPVLQVIRRLTGTNTSQPVGTKGTMTITIRNRSGGSVKNIHLKDVLPVEYVVDPTYTPTIAPSSPYGAYPGRVDTIVWTNPQPAALPLTNTAPEYDLTSNSVAHPIYADQVDMLRHGDTAVITFRVVLINSDYYDRNANLDVNPEEFPVTGTDPNLVPLTPLTNTLTVDFDTFCATQGAQSFTMTGNGTLNANGTNLTGAAIPAFPEDLDIVVGGDVFILTNDPNQLLTLPVLLTNRGGHDARDYHAFVTFGTTMEVVNAQAGCSDITPAGPLVQPDPWKVWVDTTPLPTTATIYECISPATISPNQTVTLNFDVKKTTDPARIAIDDLSLRADVVGEITLSDGAFLDFPAPILRADGETDRANNYSMDAAWARVIGFNLIKTQLGTCNENNPPTFDTIPGNGYEEVQIGEECTFHIDTGGWFGFETPGFAYIAVQDIDVVDEVAAGQVYISDVDAGSTALITGVTFTPPGPALAEGQFDWRFNVANADRIEVADEWFRVNATTRVLNNPVDLRSPPNVHAANSTNILNSTFDATFSNINTGDVETYTLGPTTIGYPNEPIRRVDLRVTEPNLIVTKQVCNETLAAAPPIVQDCIADDLFADAVSDGDTNDSYIYKITLTNEANDAASPDVLRAPAYNVISTDILDVSDLMLIEDFALDGLDNDGDGAIDEADEITADLVSENVVMSGGPAEITVSYTHSAPLVQVDPGASITFYYRVDPDDAIAPLQLLTNEVTMDYDTLLGPFGNQTAPQLNNTGTPAEGRARIYTSNLADADVRMIPLVAQPKEIIDLSNTATALAGSPQNVVVGEEIRYQLTAQLPVANLRSFKIRDELPAGITCVEAPSITLEDPQYAAAGFDPGTTISGPIVPTCNGTVVEWNFGNQELTNTTLPGIFNFVIDFIARVENTTVTNDGVTITNGGGTVDPLTCTGGVGVCYIDETLSPVALEFAPVSVVVRDPVITLTKSFAVANSDAADVLTVTVRATNNPALPANNAAAYNLQVLDNLVDSDMTYIVGSEGGVGTNKPDNVDISVPNRPVFSWDRATNPDYEIAPGTFKEFTFQVRVDTTAQPLEILDNTIEAKWDSLPGQDVALNSTGIIGLDGSLMGLRNGTVPNTWTVGNPNDYEITASAETSVRPLTLDKTDLDPLILTLPVGDHKRFQIDIDLPEGTTNAVLLKDNLAFSGLSYVLENDAVFDVTYSFPGIASINSQPPGEAAFNSFPADESSNVVSWDIGTVVTLEEDDYDTVPNAISPRIRITYYARVNNDANTNVGSTLQNEATLNYQNGETPATTEVQTDTTAPITVIEPLLTVSKVLTNETPGKATTDLPDAGDLIQYVITVNNNNPGNSIAYDVNLVDTLPPDLRWYSGFTPTALINGSLVAGFGAIPPGGEPEGPLVWGRNNAVETLDIPVNGTLVITYQAEVENTSEANRVLSNSVVVDWTSLDGVNADERTGSNVPPFNDYFTAPPAVATTTVIDNNSITKARNDDSYLDTGNVRVGDTVDYTLTLRLQEGTTRAITLVDTLPNGMEFVGVLSVNGDSAAPYSSAGVFTHADISSPVITTGPGNNTVSWTLGNAVTGIVNAADNNAANDDFVIVYRAQVVNDELPMPQDANTNLINNAVMDYQDSNNIVVSLNDDETIVAQQPIIFMADLSKVRRGGLLSGNPVASGEIMDFRLSACNSGGAPAYDLILEDILPAELDETTITPPVVTINGGATIATDYVYTPPAGPGGTMRFLFNNEAKPVNPGQCAVIEFDISVQSPIGIGQTFVNQFQAVEYHSLDADNPNQLERETYGLAGPVLFNMNTVIGVIAPDKSLLAPLSHEATIGEIVTYQVKVPGDSGTMSVDLFDVLISDDMASNLTFVDAELDASSTYTGAFDTSASMDNQVRIEIDLLPVMAGTTQQAVFNIRARVNNDANTNALLPAPTPAFGNVASYTFNDTDGGITIIGGSAATPGTDDISIVEPVVTLVSKTVANQIQANALTDAGDILRYTLVINAAAGATESDAFDISVVDNLSLGLVYLGNPTVTLGGGNVIVAPTISGDGIATPQTLNWDLANGTDIDIPEGSTVTITYDVVVLDSVLALQNLSNSAQVQWTSLDGLDVPGGPGEGERNGSNVPVYNDYFSAIQSTTVTTPDNNTITKTRITDTFGAGDATVRIGDIVEYRLLVSLHEGTHPNAIITDTLPAGMQFEETVSINGNTIAPFVAVAPFIHPDIAAPPVVAGPATVTWTLGNLVNTGDNDIPIANNDFEIIYRARVLNLVLDQLPNTQPLTNSVDFTYDTATVPSTQNDTETVTVLQPNLSVAKTRIPVLPLDTVVDAGEVVTYRVDINNAAGTAPAYDTVLRDIIPLGARIAGVTTTNVQLIIGGVPQPALPNLVPVFDGATGTAIWDFDTAIADQYTIPAGETLRIEYQVQADAGLGAGLTLTNEAQVQLYYSFDNDVSPSLGGINGVREIYGPSNLAQVTLTTTPANELLKTNPTDLDASIGETFTYRITVPGVLQATALYDVQILDDLVNDSAADLMFVSVAPVGITPWTPVNISTVTDDLVIADTTNGIDIPANTQIAIDITVTLRNSLPTNVTTLAFTNAATYTFNQVNDEDGTVSNGLGNTTPPMNIVEPDLTLVKTGPAGTVNFLAPIPYTVVVENIGDGPAFDTTIVDQLPDVPDNLPLTGGTCDTAPINIVANVYANDGTTLNRALLLDTDYTATHTAAPVCELVITTITDKARIEATEKLIVTYETTLDVGTQSGAALTNIAGVTRWFSLDTAGAGVTGEIREYTSTLTDSVTVTVEAPVLDVQKTVTNVTTVTTPGDNATPGDRLSYTIVITNNGLVDANAVILSDAVPANATYIADTVTLNGAAVGVPDGGVSPLIAGIDISSSDLPLPTPGNGTITVGQTATVTFDVLLNPAITSGTVISNQAIVDSPSTGAILSDDPVAPGTADPTTTLITSAPEFLVQKTSLDITGDPAILLPGDTLRYTLTVKNIGLEDAINSLLSDQIPANTTYIANSTRLNAVVVADPAAGISPLAAGMLINAPENTTAGYLRADTNAAANNVATITFDVVVNLSAVSGTVISNQGFFNGSGAGSGVFPQQLSDDPDTALVDDPTIDVVGNVPVINSLKTVALEDDVNLNGFVDPGDTLRYTITTTNIGAMPATGVVLTDDLDQFATGLITYVPGSGLLDGLPAGISFSGSVLTATIGDLLPATSTVVIFDVTVDAGVLPGTIISNQGSVASNELPIELTDADGNNANGYQTTDIVVGNVQQLAISKQVTVIGGGAAEPGKQLEYIVRVTNIGAVAAQNVVITDVLDPAVMSYVAGSGLLDGLVTGVSYDDTTIPTSPTLTADYSAIYGDLPVAAVTELRFRVLLDAALSIGDTVTNTVGVTWDVTVPPKSANASVSIDIGGIPGSANINGQVWHDTDFDNIAGAGEALLQDYRVELYRNGILLANAVTDVGGVYVFSGLPPNTIANPYEVRFIAPGATSSTATLGTTNSDFTDGSQRITGIFAASGTNLQNLNLPRQVNGVVYDSVLRVPVAGVQLTLINQTRSNQLVPEECFGDGTNANQAEQVTPAGGYYKFDLNFSDSSRCARGDEYEIQVQPPADDFTGTTSVIIPPVEPVTGAALNVPNCPNTAADKILATTEHCENSASDLPAPATVPPRTPGTDYHLKFLFSDAAPGTLFTDQIYNNHIPVDGVLEAAVAISKVTGKLNVTRSDLVPYTITFNNTLGVPLFDVSIIDNFPAGFKYVTGSARVDGAEMEPQVNGRLLTWPGLSAGIDESRVIKLLLIVGSGVGEGEYVNQAWAINTLTNGELSGVATATVRVIPDPSFDCTDIIGKVFDDKNLNGYQDQGETGLPGVQVATARGLRVTTDSHGRFHITCAIVANEVRGSNFIMKLDDRTLPSGYRVTTENPRVQRATRGKMLKFNFGTAIHRVVRLDLADGVFQKGSTELRPQWRSRIELLITELQKEGSILRLSYLAENESEGEVDDRLDAIEGLVSDRWQELDCCYKLTIEKEVFWRKGSPSAGREFAE